MHKHARDKVRAAGGAGSSRPALRVPRRLLSETFEQLRRCGQGREECQVLWLGPWSTPDIVTELVHPRHRASRDGFVLDEPSLTALWLELANRGYGIRVQVHTHPGRAFHSAIDDAWPIVHLEGFLSLVIPNFALGAVGLKRTYLARIDVNGQFRSVDPTSNIVLV